MGPGTAARATGDGGVVGRRTRQVAVAPPDDAIKPGVWSARRTGAVGVGAHNQAAPMKWAMVDFREG